MAKKTHAETTALIVGGGFGGVACAKKLAEHGVSVTLLDKNNYHQFQPLLYQVATGMLGPADIARPLRAIFAKHKTVDVKQAEVAHVDVATRTVRTTEGTVFSADYLVLAMGSQPNFFNTAGAVEHTFPLYSLDDAERLRSRVFEVFEDADSRPELVERGALNFVIVGGGATGVETAGALADLVNEVMPERFHDLAVRAARVYVVDVGNFLLAPFSDDAHEYAAKALQKKGVELRMGCSAKEIRDDRVVLSDGTEILTHTVVWAGGLQAPELASVCQLRQGRGGRFQVERDLSIEGVPGVFAIGDVANIPGADGHALPQLGSVALQAGTAAAHSILADVDGQAPPAFHYHDKGIMAMIGRGAAVAEVGKHHHELHGPVAFAAWLGVHAWLLSGVRERVDAFISWGWDNLGHARAASVIDRPDAARIDWGTEDES
jgi:NADH dehydrogenase